MVASTLWITVPDLLQNHIEDFHRAGAFQLGWIHGPFAHMSFRIVSVGRPDKRRH